MSNGRWRPVEDTPAQLTSPSLWLHGTSCNSAGRDWQPRPALGQNIRAAQEQLQSCPKKTMAGEVPSTWIEGDDTASFPRRHPSGQVDQTQFPTARSGLPLSESFQQGDTTAAWYLQEKYHTKQCHEVMLRCIQNGRLVIEFSLHSPSKKP